MGGEVKSRRVNNYKLLIFRVPRDVTIIEVKISATKWDCTALQYSQGM